MRISFKTLYPKLYKAESREHYQRTARFRVSDYVQGKAGDVKRPRSHSSTPTSLSRSSAIAGTSEEV